MNRDNLRDIVNQIKLDQETKERIRERTLGAFPEREEMMKRNRTGKLVVIACAAALILGVSAKAGSNIIASIYGGSSSTPEYTALPTEEECRKEIGFVPILPETLGDGYEFQDASVVHNKSTDKEGTTIETFNSLSCRYRNAEDEIDLDVEKTAVPMPLSGEIADTVDEVAIYYESYQNKLVPPDYEMTEEDKKLEESGALVFSYGMPKVTVRTVQCAAFEKDGIRYGLLQSDGALDREDLVEIAKKMIQDN